MILRATFKPLLKLCLPRLASFQWNFENWSTFDENTKNLIFIKFRYFNCLSYPLYSWAILSNICVNNTILTFWWLHQVGIRKRSIGRDSPPELFYKRRCYQKSCKSHRKTIVPESLLKRDSDTDVFSWILQNLRTLILQSICEKLLLNWRICTSKF